MFKSLSDRWELKKISSNSMADIIMGQSPPSSTYNENAEGLPFYQGKADFGDFSPKVRVWCSKPVRIAKSDDILISVRAPVGPVNYAVEECCIGRGLAAIRSKKNLLPKYIYYFFKYYQPYLENQGHGSTFSSINRTFLENLEIPIPPTLDEQQEIVDVLDLAADIVKERQAAIEITEQIIPAVFYEMFGDPLSNEKGFPITTIGNVTIDTKQINPKNLEKENIYYVDIASINNELGIIENPKYILSNKAPSRARKMIKTDDVLISTTRPYLRGFAKVPSYLDGEIASTGFAVLRCDIKKILPNFLFSFTRTSNFLEQITPLMRGASYPAVTDKDIKNVKIILPNIKEQEKFAEIAEGFENLLQEQRAALKFAQDEFQALLQMAFTGELTARKYSGVA